MSGIRRKLYFYGEYRYQRGRLNFMKNVMSAISRTIGVIIIIIIVIMFALKGCIIKSWSHPPENSTYAIYGYDGRIIKLIFLEKQKRYFITKRALTLRKQYKLI
jgi:hypothetical protein